LSYLVQESEKIVCLLRTSEACTVANVVYLALPQTPPKLSTATNSIHVHLFLECLNLDDLLGMAKRHLALM
jgi:hypothetical protein